MRKAIFGLVLSTLVLSLPQYTAAASDVPVKEQSRFVKEAKARAMSSRKLALACSNESEGKPYTFKNNESVIIGNNRLAAVFSAKSLDFTPSSILYSFRTDT